MARARSRKSATVATCARSWLSGSCARSGTARGGTANSYSADRCRAARLVTTRCRRGQAASKTARVVAAAITCSQLLKQGTIKSFPQSERLGNGGNDEFRLASARQRYKADAVSEVGVQSRGGS